MTATPIPRTAAMVVSATSTWTVVDEQPPGRAPITTVWARGDLEEAAAWQRIRSEVAAGHRAYVVCPLVEESERVVARSAVGSTRGYPPRCWRACGSACCTASCRPPRRRR